MSMSAARHQMYNPNQPVSQTWQILSGAGEIAWEITSTKYPLWAWWPTLEPDLCQMLAGSEDFDIPTTDPAKPREPEVCTRSGRCICTRYPAGCRDPRTRAALRKSPFYVCPRDGRSRSQARKCGQHESYYCRAWGCETTGDAWWNPSSSWDLIQVKRDKQSDEPPLTTDYCKKQYRWDKFEPLWYGDGPCTSFACNPLSITFTSAGKTSRDWLQGRLWGLRVYKQTAYDPGVLFKIRLKINTDPQPLGPNRVLPDQKPLPPRRQRPIPSRVTPPLNTTHLKTPTPPTMLASPTLSGSGERLIDLVEGGYEALNFTQPNLTKSCWLCLRASPPYYEGIAINGTFTYDAPSSCNWGTKHMLTLSEVTGSGTCLGHPPLLGNNELCARTISKLSSDKSKYVVPSTGQYWACDTGITPCVSIATFNQSRNFCVLVKIYPRLLYYSTEEFEGHFMGRTRFSREPVSITLAVLLGARILAGVGTGAAALIENPRQLGILEAAVQQDLRAIETSVTALEKSLTSLSEVVLQNRRGLDLLFLKEGGLCAALKEDCCFYTDHTGVVRESMTKLRERLDARERSLRSSQSWFEGWFNKSPWLTTLLSTIAGPLIILLLILTFGPCTGFL
ncbi:hypothetical protein H1C71_014276 [Ictidomys tridecemlineatus]|uniref:Envelope protein n=1 Tax=Ictidomys tridecemlineatus TaxID=43179 RepID=A0A287D6W6_ICTTR|nr:hypothetical protein H1C71_014276 [Ictidomys tridecemlineatus]